MHVFKPSNLMNGYCFNFQSDDLAQIIKKNTVNNLRFGDNAGNLASYAGPGNWNDPDMLIIGDYGLSFEQSETQVRSSVSGYFSAGPTIALTVSKIAL